MVFFLQSAWMHFVYTPEESIAFGCNFIVEKHFYGSVSLLVFRDNDGSALGRHQEMASTRKSDFVRNTLNHIPLFLFWNYPKSHPVVFLELFDKKSVVFC